MIRSLKAKARDLFHRRHSLAIQSWGYLTGFSAFILLILWLLQFALFTPFYETMQLDEIRRAGRAIAKEYESAEQKTQALQKIWQSAFRRNLRVMLLDGASNVVLNFDGFGSPFEPGGGRGRMDEPELLLEFAESGSTESTCISRTDTNAGKQSSDYGEGDVMRRAVYLARLQPSASGGDRYLYVASPIPAQDSTVRVLMTQFVIITFILLVLSSFAAILLSRRIARPILALKDAATNLAKGGFRAPAQKNGYSEIDALSQELVHTTEELAKTERYQKELVANVSHDLKTPLTIVRFYAELLRDISGANPERRTAHCEKIISETEKLTGMVNEMLELSRLEQAAADARHSPLHLSGLLRETAGRFTALSESEGYLFESDIAPHVFVCGQEALLGRVIYNLIANAVNHTGEDKRVLLRLLTVQNENGANPPKARVEISDTGNGIPPEELEHIWERYYKSSQPHRRGIIGTGLGLSIVRDALERHCALYGVTSVPGQGSTFWFEIPVCQADSPPSAGT
ncbi:MAG: HAMP domain-containing histidine kinase [Oscillospiraceae bacterium]|nr:HAMP domain-containing histidine kinase [Oscillospiraceae bacterium]